MFLSLHFLGTLDAGQLAGQLEQEKKTVWCEGKMEDSSEEAVAEGIAHSDSFLLFLSGDAAPPTTSTSASSGGLRRAAAARLRRLTPRGVKCATPRLRTYVRTAFCTLAMPLPLPPAYLALVFRPRQSSIPDGPKPI